MDEVYINFNERVQGRVREDVCILCLDACSTVWKDGLWIWM